MKWKKGKETAFLWVGGSKNDKLYKKQQIEKRIKQLKLRFKEITEIEDKILSGSNYLSFEHWIADKISSSNFSTIQEIKDWLIEVGVSGSRKSRLITNNPGANVIDFLSHIASELKVSAISYEDEREEKVTAYNLIIESTKILFPKLANIKKLNHW